MPVTTTPIGWILKEFKKYIAPFEKLFAKGDLEG